MSFHKLLIANRGEIAIRIARAAGDAGLATVAIHSADDAQSLHIRAADAACEIPGRGARAYLDIEAVISAAKATGCDAVHPGYGFLSENATLARRCIEESIVFVGPSPEALDLFGDKAQAKALAKRCGVPVIEGSGGPTSLEEARAFLESLGAGGAIMIKAIAGGGGRGMRIVDDADKLEDAYARCQSAAPGRAYRHRGGARPRSRAVAARGRCRRHAGFARSGAGLYPKTARLCDAAPRQHGGDGRDRRDPADRRDADDVRPAVRPRRSRRYVRLFRVSHQHRLRLAARQGHRAFARWKLDRRRAQ